MVRIKKQFWFCACINLCHLSTGASTGALAADPLAQITETQGKVMINVGKGFVQATPLTSLQAGDRIFVGAKSSVTLNYPAKMCSAVLSKAAVVQLTKTPLCKAEMIFSATNSATLLPPTAQVVPSSVPVPSALSLVAAVPLVGWAATQVISPLPDTILVELAPKQDAASLP